MKEINEYPIRVLQAVGVMNRGGAETLLMNVYRNIDRNKVQFDFLTHHSIKGAYDDEIIRMGGKIYTVPYGPKTLHIGYINALSNFFENHTEYRIVHSHMSDAAGILGKAAQRANIPVRIAHSHISNPTHSVIQKLYLGQYSRRLIPKNCTDYFACSKAAGEYLYGKYINDSSFRIIKNGVDLENFACKNNEMVEAKKLLNCANEVIIGHVGRFEKQKNHEFVIDIFHEFNKRVPNSKLILIGGGALGDKGIRPLIEQKVAKYNLIDKVKFLGVRSDVDKLIKGFDLFVFPSLYEGLPITLIEAQASGVKCLISNKITKEIDLGLGTIEFLNIENVELWVDTMIKYLEMSNVLTEDCIKIVRAKGYDIKTTAKELERFYLKRYIENIYI